MFVEGPWSRISYLQYRILIKGLIIGNLVVTNILIKFLTLKSPYFVIVHITQTTLINL